MSHQLSDSFVQHFENIEDPRRQAGLRHPLIEVLFIAICGIIAGYAQENLATMRRIAINMLNQEQTRKDSLKGKRQLAGWDESYMERIIFN